ncbi:MAG: hypothetical protein RL148_2325 [Planctomycetota bacterium]
MSRPRLLLASTSPRRSRLLNEAGIRFALVEPGPEPMGCGTPVQLALFRAREKAVGARFAAGESVPVLGVDTVVDLGGTEFGKAGTREAAESMLRQLSGRVHHVHTGHCLHVPATGTTVEEVVTAEVVFTTPTEVQLEAWLASGLWRGKAGAYGIQDPLAAFASLHRGPLDAVVGMHVDAVLRLLARVEQEALQ